MNAVIDIGNTRVKIGLFDNKGTLEAYSLKPETVLDFLKSNSVNKILLSNVGKKDVFIENILSEIKQSNIFRPLLPI